MNVPLQTVASPEPTGAQGVAVTDLEAIAGVVAGQREMFAVIVRRYNQPLYRVGMAYLRDHGLTEDAMQNTYVKAFLNLSRYRQGSAFSTWLTRIMINECLMMLRRSRREARPPGGDGRSEPPATENVVHHVFDESTTVADNLNREDVSAVLETAISALPRKYRAVYVLREVQQLSTDDVADLLGVSAVSVKVDLHRARERLKVELLRSAAGTELFAYRARHCDPMTAAVMERIRAL